MGKGDPVPPGFLGNLSPEQEESLIGLQEALADVRFPASGLEEEHLCLWGVPLHSLSESMGTSQKVVLLKFLRSRDFDVERAADKLMRTLQWRKTYGIAHILNESFPKEMDGLCYNYGRDRNGRPVQYNIYANLDPSILLADEDSVEAFIRWRVRHMEETIAMKLDFDNGIEDIVHVHDYSGVKLLRMDMKFKEVTQRIIRVFGDYYPEMLSVKYFINVPRVVELLFNVVSIFVNPKTVSKFQLCCQHKIRASLLNRICPEELPPAYGGFLHSDDGSYTSQLINVPACSKVNLNFQLDSNQELRWEFLTECLDIGVRAGVQGSRDSMDYGRREYGVGKYKNMATESVVLTLDNSYSLFTSKAVWIRTGVFSS